ncbi:3'-5' exonuclease [Methylobacterium sp. E-066]|uniref:3'-5' exonuclease n=1 Tax=Methylobacterium sp. E-066 TaxID=2836584 RepID=UPI001FB99D1E|nr:3'-5' exonuclease [Methylobacterium sp. E-066]MCJ2143876.1 3'-5' exonuclease [Methylobacterium sp. E-066]
MDTFESELHAIALRCSPDFRVLRKLARRGYCERPLGPYAKTGIIVDVETTGLELSAEIIEIGLLKFIYTPAGVVLGTLGQRQALNEPGVPIPPQVTRLTGITDETVRGHRFDVEALQTFARGADIVIAHNATFDRRHIEKVLPVFEDLPWACSQTQVPWSDEGIEGTKLFYIAHRFGFFFEGHRSLDDTYALLEVLEQPLPRSGKLVLSELLEAAKRPSLRVYALGLPYALRDEVRARGYRWSAGEDGRPRAWHRDCEAREIGAELAFLNALDHDATIEPLVLEIDAFVRFSARHG